MKRFVPEDKILYTGAEGKMNSEEEIDSTDELKDGLTAFIGPIPNSKCRNPRWGLYFHYKAQREKPGFINKFINKKIGEEPVYLSDVKPGQTEDILKNWLENRGYFYNRVDYTVEEYQEQKEAKVFYKAFLPEVPYVLENYKVDNDSLRIYQQIQQTLGDAILKSGEPFNLTQMKMERERIDRELKSQGYYNFSANFLIFEADTNQYDRKKFDLFLKLKEEVPEEGIKPYVVTTINVYPNYVVGTDSLERDVRRYNNRNYIQNETFFEPDKLHHFRLFEEVDR